MKTLLYFSFVLLLAGCTPQPTIGGDYSPLKGDFGTATQKS